MMSEFKIQPGPTQPRGRGKIMIVEDELDLVRVIKLQLNSVGYDTISVADGAEASIVAAAEKPDVILLDIKLPSCNGHVAAKNLRDNPATMDIPIVFVTASCEVSDIMQAVSVGAAGYVTKPFSSDELLRAISQSLSAQASERLTELNRSRSSCVQSVQICAIDPKEEVSPIVQSAPVLARRILVVEDEPELARFIEMRLSHSGYTVDLAVDADHAFANIHRNLPDLILLDIGLPYVNGHEIAELLLDNLVFREIPVIYITARTSPEDRIRAALNRASAYLTKPFRSDELLSVIEKALIAA